MEIEEIPNPHCPELPVFDLSVYLSSPDRGAPGLQRLCARMAECLSDTGALVVRDPRVETRDNEVFLSLMERYFEQPREAKMADVRPELAYQVQGGCVHACVLVGAGPTPDGDIGKTACSRSKRCPALHNNRK